MEMKMQATNWDGTPNTDRSNKEGECDRCGNLIQRFRGDGDLCCTKCDANYNASGQRLRDDLYTMPNRSSWDDDCDDMEGYEEAALQSERFYDNY